MQTCTYIYLSMQTELYAVKTIAEEIGANERERERCVVGPQLPPRPAERVLALYNRIRLCIPWKSGGGLRILCDGFYRGIMLLLYCHETLMLSQRIFKYACVLENIQSPKSLNYVNIY